VPFDILPLPGAGAALVGERLETAVLPHAGPVGSASLAAGRVLLAGDPLPDAAGRFAALPRAAAELDGLAALYGGATVRLAKDRFTRAELDKADLGAFRTIHLATHAEASTTSPEKCRVVLSNGETLGIDAVAKLRLDASLVVLSACRTGQGEVIPGEGVVGLGWAFLRAGARSLVASLWTVDDAAASALMVDFHRRLRTGTPPRTALAAARRAQRARTPHPAYWAPFVLVERPG
jgi:CHAT domain-containing protein